MHFFVWVLSCLALAYAQSVTGPLTKDFQDWLNKNGYSDDDFVREDLGTDGSYGGKSSAKEKISKRPVIFIHGNSDCALNHPGLESIATGWTNSIEYFESKGYTEAELYATSWGDTNELEASLRTHDCPTLTRLRRWIEAVIKYTNASKIDIVSHSMGVTLGRKLIQGGAVAGGSCNLGDPLNKHVNVFVGISGGNYGLCNCQGAMELTCNQQNGFWPGDSCGLNFYTCELNPPLYPCTTGPAAYSAYLTDINTNPLKIASYLFSAWSQDDDLIMYHDMVWGKPTSLMPNSTDHKTYTLLTHMQTKELTAADQYNMVVYHTIS